MQIENARREVAAALMRLERATGQTVESFESAPNTRRPNG